jgi:hypothetical protein
MDPQSPAAPTVSIDPEGVKRLGATLARRFTQYESDRRLAELKWARNARQYLGIYDPDVELKMDPNRSRAYPKVTRVKCVSMLSRLMNLLFPTDDKCWGIGASPVPNLAQDDLQSVLDQALNVAQGQTPSDETIEQAIREFAKKRALRLEREVEDQLQELGGSRSLDFVALCRKVLASGIQYGMGVLKGPMLEEVTLRHWQKDASGRLMAVPYQTMRPRFEFVPIWEYYPDMSAKDISQMDGQFQRIVMSKHQVTMLAQRPDFLKAQVEEFLRISPSGNYKRKAFETDIKAMGVQVNVTESERNKYEALIWQGYVSGKELQAAGADVPEAQLQQDVQAQVWFMGDTVIKADLDPWSTLDTDGAVPMYHHFVFEEDESSLLGNGLPNIVRDSQMGICAGTRMVMDNGSVQRNFEVNTELLSMGQDMTSIQTDKIWYRSDTNPATVQIPAVRNIELPMHLPEMQALVKMFQEFADQETFVGAATGGDMQRGPSEPFRTASGASMLRGDAALPFKDVVRNFDVFTESVIGAVINFNRNYNDDERLRGDFTPVARGATSLIAKEVLGIQLDNLAQTLTPEEKLYINMRELVRARVRVRDLTVEDIVVDDAEADRREAAQAQAQQEQQVQQTKLIEAQIREILANSLNKIAQAGKNTANADATTANVLLAALEKGIDPNALDTHPQPEQPAGGNPLVAGNAGTEAGAGYAGAPEMVADQTGQDGSPTAGMPPSRMPN